MKKTCTIVILSMLLLTGCKSNTGQNLESSFVSTDRCASTATEYFKKEFESIDEHTDKSTESDIIPENLNELPVISDNIQEVQTEVTMKVTDKLKEPEIHITSIATDKLKESEIHITSIDTENTIDVSTLTTTATTVVSKSDVIELPFVPAE